MATDLHPSLYHALCNVTAAPTTHRWCDFATSSIWADRVICFGQENVAKVMMCRFWARPEQALVLSVFLPLSPLPPARKHAQASLLGDETPRG